MKKFIPIIFLLIVSFSGIAWPKSSDDIAELERFAQKGSAFAKYSLGVIYNSGAGVPPDYKKAFDWFLKAAEQGNTAAQRQLGFMYRSGSRAPKDASKAFEWYAKAAKQGDAIAQYNLGIMYSNGQGIPQDYQKAFEWYSKAATQGNAGAQTNLGEMYRLGQGVQQDNKQAFEWFSKAAAQGNAGAQTNLGVMYDKGYSVPQDYKKAFEWYLKAAGQVISSAIAQYNLAAMYDLGLGVRQDYPKAVEWYLKAANRGHANAQLRLGELYRYEHPGIPQDYIKSFWWYTKAAEQGDTRAQNSLGGMYESGEGVYQDMGRAKEYYGLACDAGDQRGCDEFRRLNIGVSSIPPVDSTVPNIDQSQLQSEINPIGRRHYGKWSVGVINGPNNTPALLAATTNDMEEVLSVLALENDGQPFMRIVVSQTGQYVPIDNEVRPARLFVDNRLITRTPVEVTSGGGRVQCTLLEINTVEIIENFARGNTAKFEIDNGDTPLIMYFSLSGFTKTIKYISERFSEF